MSAAIRRAGSRAAVSARKHGPPVCAQERGWVIQTHCLVAIGGGWAAWRNGRGAECGPSFCGRRPSIADCGREPASDAWVTDLPRQIHHIDSVPRTPGAADRRGTGRRVARTVVGREGQAACSAWPRARRPRCVRIVSITGVSRIAAMISSSRPQFGQRSRSISKAKLQRRLTCIQVMSQPRRA